MAGGLNRFGMGFIFTAADLATPTLKRLTKGVQKLGNESDIAMEGINAGLKTAAGGLALFAAGMAGLVGMKKLADVAGEFEYEMKAVEVITGAVGEELVMLTDAAYDAGLSMTQFNPADAAQGLRIFSQAGFAAKESMEALTPTLDLAASSIGQLSLDKASGLAVSGLRLFALKSDQTRWMMDRMAKATIMSSIQFKELPLAIGVAARGVIAMNASLEDTLIGLGLVRNIIPTTERAATAFATSLEKLSAPKSKKEIIALGVEVATLDGKLRPTLDIIGELGIKLEQMTEESRKAWVQTVFGKRSMAGLFAITRQLNEQALNYSDTIEGGMIPAIEALRKKMREADGTAVKLRDALLGTWKGMKEVLGAQATGLITVLGDAFAKLFKPIIEQFALFANFMAKVWKGVPGPLKKAIAGFLALLAATTALTGAIVVIAGLAKIIGVIFVAGSATVLAIFGGIMAAIAATVGWILVLRQAWVSNFGGIQDFILPIINRVIFAFQVLFELFRTGGTLSEDMGKKLVKDKSLFTFVAKVFMIGSRLIAFFEGIGEAVGEAFEELSNDVFPLFDAIGELFSEIVCVVGEVFKAISEAFGFFGDGTDKARSFGVTVVAIFTGLMRVAIFITKFFIIPAVKAFALVFKLVAKFIGPLLSVMIHFGKLVFKVLFGPMILFFMMWNKNWTGALDLLKGVVNDMFQLFAGLVNLIINVATGIAAVFIAPFVQIAKFMKYIGLGESIADKIIGAQDFLLKKHDIREIVGVGQGGNLFGPKDQAGTLVGNGAKSASTRGVSGIGGANKGGALAGPTAVGGAARDVAGGGATGEAPVVIVHNKVEVGGEDLTGAISTQAQYETKRRGKIPCGVFDFGDGGEDDRHWSEK